MLFNIKSLADLRAALYALLPIVSTLLVGYGVLDDAQAALWVGLVAAVLGPVIAAFNAPKADRLLKSRTAFYAVLGAVQALALGYGLIHEGQFDAWMPLVTALVGSAAAVPAVANTDTTRSDGGSV